MSCHDAFVTVSISASTPDDDPFRILCVCTGNVFRSRLAEHFLRVGLSERDRSNDFSVASAGTGVLPGRPIGTGEAAGLQRCGLPADARPSRRVSAADIDGADLVLCADRSHRAAVLELAPGALRRTFLIREFARVAGAAFELAANQRSATRPSPVTVTPAERARRVVADAATFRGHVPSDGSDEIGDPFGEPDTVLRSAAGLVREAVPGVLDPLTGLVDRAVHAG